MKKKGFGIVAIIISTLLVFLSCASTQNSNGVQSNNNKKAQVVVYLLDTKTPEYEDVACLSILEGQTSGMTSYTVDRYQGDKQMLMVMEFGNYTIEGDQITFVAGKYNFKGTIVEDKIIIDGKEYIKQNTKK